MNGKGMAFGKKIIITCVTSERKKRKKYIGFLHISENCSNFAVPKMRIFYTIRILILQNNE